MRYHIKQRRLLFPYHHSRSGDIWSEKSSYSIRCQSFSSPGHYGTPYSKPERTVTCPFYFSDAYCACR